LSENHAAAGYVLDLCFFQGISQGISHPNFIERFARNGLAVLQAPETYAALELAQLMGTALEKSSRARGEYVPMVVVQRSFRR